ncbi:MAG: thiamine pyrophosphate-dependent enzyme [Thermomicrobiales bacterium]
MGRRWSRQAAPASAHSGDDDDRYRSAEEVAALRRNDPVARFRRELIARDLLDDAADMALTRELRAEIDEATSLRRDCA